jgi:hypothetical protein
VNESWRWVFLVNVPIGLVTLLLAARWVPDTRHNTAAQLPDLAGVALLMVAIGALALGLVKGPDWGWTSTAGLASFGVAIVGLAAFWHRSLRHPSPVIEPALLRVRAFAWSNVTALAFSTAFAAGLLANVLWLQDVWHYSALATGLAITPGPVMVPIFAALAQRVAHRVPVGVIAAAGAAMFAAGSLVILVSLGAHADYLGEALPGWLMTGVGVGLALPTIMSAATVDLPAARTATGSAVVNMSRQVGSVLGVSLLVALLGHPVGYAMTHAGYDHARLVIAGAAVLATLSALGMTPRSRRVTDPAAEPVSPIATLVGPKG